MVFIKETIIIPKDNIKRIKNQLVNNSVEKDKLKSIDIIPKDTELNQNIYYKTEKNNYKNNNNYNNKNNNNYINKNLIKNNNNDFNKTPTTNYINKVNNNNNNYNNN